MILETSTGERKILTKSSEEVFLMLVNDMIDQIPTERLEELAMSKGHCDVVAFCIAQEIKTEYGSKGTSEGKVD